MELMPFAPYSASSAASSSSDCDSERKPGIRGYAMDRILAAPVADVKVRDAAAVARFLRFRS